MLVVRVRRKGTFAVSEGCYVGVTTVVAELKLEPVICDAVVPDVTFQRIGKREFENMYALLCSLQS